MKWSVKVNLRGDFMNNKQLGERISELRNKHNLTQKELANRIYVSDKTISKWETGKSMPDLSTLYLLAETFEISMIELLQLKGEQTDPSKTIMSAYNREKRTVYYRSAILSTIIISMLICSMYIFYRAQDNRVTKTSPLENMIVTCEYLCLPGHKAIDVSNNDLINGIATNIYAIEESQVADFGNSHLYGYWITLSGENFTYIYRFLDNVDGIRIGQHLEEGEYLVTRNPITVGWSSGPHIEIQVYHNYEIVDPMEVLVFKQKN